MFDYRRVSQSLMLQRCLWLCGQRLAAPTLNYARNFCNIHPFGFIIISLLKWQFLKQIRYQAQSFLNNIVIYCIYIIIYTILYIQYYIYTSRYSCTHLYTIQIDLYIYHFVHHHICPQYSRVSWPTFPSRSEFGPSVSELTEQHTGLRKEKLGAFQRDLTMKKIRTMVGLIKVFNG